MGLTALKSVTRKRAHGVVSQDGTPDMEVLRSDGPTDFARLGGLYFTYQMWAAKHYSRSIGDACPVSGRRTVVVTVPLGYPQARNMLELDFGNTWKELVFYSRRNQPYTEEISQLRRKRKIIHGPIAHSANKSFGKMTRPSDIESKRMLWQDAKSRSGDLGKQHVGSREEAIIGLNEVVKDKVWVRKPGKRLCTGPRPMGTPHGTSDVPRQTKLI